MKISIAVLLPAALAIGSAALAQAKHAAPAMREIVYRQLSEAQACVERKDYQCAFDKVDAVGRMEDLNSYEQAQRWNFLAFLRFQEEDFTATIAAYERVLEQLDTPLPMQPFFLIGTEDETVILVGGLDYPGAWFWFNI